MFIAIAEVYLHDGNNAYQKNELSNAIHFYTEGIQVNCKDDVLNAKLYNNRAAAQIFLGKILFFIFFEGCYIKEALNELCSVIKHAGKG